MRKAEILAPAGSVEQLVAAVNNGCDSVYLGLDSFNARMKAPNFTAENISQWIDYCHTFGVKVYVAINTSIKNDEFERAVELLKTAYLSNADGVIVTDLALIRIASQLPKPFDVVASTQLNAHDSYGAELLKECGASTVVCARESSLAEIRDVMSTGVNVECFIHGATCVCQSGQCLFSAMVGGNSGNRGLCAQPCRKLYSANNGEWGYLLSARDLCGLDVAGQLESSGVNVFKIEGRNRRGEYAGITSQVYRNLFDNNFKYAQEDVDRLAEMYNREMSSLSYLHGENDEIITPYTQNHVGVRVGTVKGNGVETVKEVVKGDGLKVFDNNKEICGGIALESGLGYISAEFSGKVKDGMEVRRTTSVKLCNEVAQAKRKLSVSIEFTAFANQHATITASCGEVSVEYASDFNVQKAQNRATKTSEIVEQLKKTGDYCYTISDIVVETNDIFLAKSQINAMRRHVLELLNIAIVDNYNKQFSNRKTAIERIVGSSSITSKQKRDNALLQNISPCIAVICYDASQLQKANGKCKYLIYKPEFVNEKTLNEAKNVNAFVDLPSFSDNGYLFDLLLQIKAGIVCHNVGHVRLARKLGLPYIAGSGLNIYNDYIAGEFSDAVTFVYSQELTLKEIAQFANQNGLIFVDGQLTLMKLVHCPYKVACGSTCAKCKAKEPLVYVDEMGNSFAVKRRKDRRCTFELLNGKKLSVTSKMQHGGRFLIDFDEKILNHYVKLNEGLTDDYVENQPYTKGRLFNKVY